MRLDQCWLPDDTLPDSLYTPMDVAQWELAQAGVDCELVISAGMGDAYEITNRGQTIHGGETGVLYGVYRLLEHRREGSGPPEGLQSPAFSLRMIDHWDNMSGNVERGYAGKSIFFADDDFRGDDTRLRNYARLFGLGRHQRYLYQQR